LRVAAIQLNSTADPERNRQVADRLVRAAAAEGAALVLLPEKWSVLGTGAETAAGAESLDGPALTLMRGLAAELRIDLVAGSIAERATGKGRNTCVHIGPDGEDRALYRKLHMFDVTVGGRAYRESDHEEPGDEVVVSSADGVGLGLTVCYDLRFPELYRELSARGAKIVCVPAAFTLATTRVHWEILLRARAIEDQCFVIAANPFGEHAPGMRSGGRSMIVDPWGDVLARADEDGEAVLVADLDLERLEQVRRDLPSLANRVLGTEVPA
jgi:deaminated glutathione amidase